MATDRQTGSQVGWAEAEVRWRDRKVSAADRGGRIHGGADEEGESHAEWVTVILDPKSSFDYADLDVEIVTKAEVALAEAFDAGARQEVQVVYFT